MSLLLNIFVVAAEINMSQMAPHIQNVIQGLQNVIQSLQNVIQGLQNVIQDLQSETTFHRS